MIYFVTKYASKNPSSSSTNYWFNLKFPYLEYLLGPRNFTIQDIVYVFAVCVTQVERDETAYWNKNIIILQVLQHGTPES